MQIKEVLFNLTAFKLMIYPRHVKTHNISLHSYFCYTIFSSLIQTYGNKRPDSLLKIFF